MTPDQFAKFLAYCRKDLTFEAYIQALRRKVWREIARKQREEQGNYDTRREVHSP